MAGCPIPISGTVENCSGGTATCIFKATCTKCGQHYGSVHSGVDNDKDHLCDLCKETLTDCVDKNNDSFCDICSKMLSSVPYVEYNWNGTKLISKNKWTEAGQVISANSKQLSAGWYVVNTDVTVKERLVVSGTVNLILKDDITLTVPKGIDVPDGSTLNIFAQSKGTGKLVAQTNKSSGAAIGGTRDGSFGNINIHGGTITAINDQHGAGIGSGNITTTEGAVTIYSGTINATGGTGGAGIGGGDNGSGGTITINGGNITATGVSGGASIII